jgi:hypothetical protein
MRRSRGLGDVYKRQEEVLNWEIIYPELLAYINRYL